MAGLTVRGLDLMLSRGFAPTYVSLHVEDPGEDGVSEIRGGNPAYARQRVQWADPRSGTRSVDAEVTFDIPQNTAPAYLGYWSSASGGDFYGSRQLPDAEHFISQGTLAFPVGSITEVLGG